VARQLVVERLAVLDVEQRAPLADITLTMTALAEATLERALTAARSEADERHGLPRNEAGEVIDFWIVGMGKLGARELNVSSDIDLIYVYEDDGETDGAVPISAHEYFALVAKKLYTLIGDVTDDGFVFRVDLALRPTATPAPRSSAWPCWRSTSSSRAANGSASPGSRAGSWRRWPAWPAAPAGPARPGHALRLPQVPGLRRLRGLRQLHRKIREEAQRRAAGRPERANDVKLSRGGIREIEFIVQLLQVVRGGQYPEIRTRATLKGLQKLAAGGLMKPETAQALADAYVFLRQVEHRIQYLDDQQTHLLPTTDADLGWIAGSLCLVCTADACELLDRLCEVRELVATEFDALLQNSQGGGGGTCRGKGCGAPLPIDSERLWEKLPPELLPRVQALATHPRVQALREEAGCAWASWCCAPPMARPRACARCRPSSISSTGWSPCCAARATWPCWWSGPMCSSACCACWAWPAGRCAT
jgi:glutamate-ammonia-ligase adenylyltransferase